MEVTNIVHLFKNGRKHGGIMVTIHLGKKHGGFTVTIHLNNIVRGFIYLIVLNTSIHTIYQANFSRTTEGQYDGIGKHGRGNVQLARILQYLECPQYLRKSFFPQHKDLQYAGIQKFRYSQL